MSIEQPKYKSGDHVRIRCDDGNWDEAWIVEVIPTYRYTVRLKPHRDYKGEPLVGVYKSGKDIRPFDAAPTSPVRTCVSKSQIRRIAIQKEARTCETCGTCPMDCPDPSMRPCPAWTPKKEPSG